MVSGLFSEIKLQFHYLLTIRIALNENLFSKLLLCFTLCEVSSLYKDDDDDDDDDDDYYY